MAQHDYTIANQGFPATRSDLNNVLQAIATNNSGTSAPTTQYAGQFWLDTNTPSSTTWSLYIHDGSDDILFAQIDTSANTVNFLDSALADDVVINTSGAITTTGAFTSKGIDDNADATAITITSAEKVLINTTGEYSGTGAEMTVNDGIDVGTTSTANGGFVTFIGDGVGQIGEVGSKVSGYSTMPNIEFHCDNVGGGSQAGHIEFNTKFSGGSRSEAVRITSGGSVGIGTTSPNGILELKSTGNTNFFITAGNTSASQVVLGDTDDIDVGKITYSHNVNSMEFIVNASERMRIDSSGNVGIGGTPTNASDHKSLALFGASGNGAGLIEFNDTSGNADGVIFADNGTLFINADYDNTTASSTIRFRIDGSSEKMRINSSGDLLIGDSSNTNPATSSTATHSCFKNGGSKLELSASNNPCLAVNRVNSEGTCVELRQAGGLRGSISVAGASASFNTSSDYRLKENVNYDFDATSRLKELKPARFNWISDETNTLVDGFIAHEVSSVVPEAIHGTKDAVDDDGNPKYQGIDQSKLVPLLVKTIQELEARITTLEANNP